ncbi:hypothetical protein J3Q64DRAFT_1746571 [Phycomyces blakesleeanus]|uniref:F-box domain-containing protein n=1 Tax=Phycomyces blakesleeanus TaxID=4837 RepID=A0ABR3AWB0_PHYBL
MSLELPFEVLSNIAEFLSLKDKIACTYVCKLWKDPFQVASWSYLKIYNSSSIYAITKPKTNEMTTYQINGKYAKGLYLYRTIRINSDCLQRIQQELPNIRNLTIGFVCLRKCNYGILSNWRNWKFLDTLIVEMDDFLANPPSGFFDIFSFLPSLKKLELVEVTPKVLELKVEDFDALQVHAPLLENIHLYGVLTTLIHKDIKNIAKTVPANNVTEFELNCLNNDQRWIYFFARKYPNLRKFILGTEEISSLPVVSCEKAVSLFASDLYAFSCLEELSVRMSGSSDDSHISFWKMFSSCNIPVKRLTYSPRFYQGTSDNISGRAIEASVKFFSNTIEELYISYFGAYKNIKDVTSALSCCTRLVKLNISTFRISIKLDKLLNGCKALKNIMLGEVDIDISSSAFNTRIPHDVSTISFVRSTITADTFNYLSPRCMKLQIMCVSESVISGSISEESGKLAIDLSSTNLKYFHLNGSEIKASNNLSDEPISINIINIHRPISRHSLGLESDINKEAKTGPIYTSNEKSMENIDASWVHIYRLFDGSGHWNSAKRVLGKKESKRARKYYSNFQIRNKAETDNEYLRSWRGQVLKKKWRKDLCRGYAEIRLGYIEKYDIDKEVWCQYERDLYRTFL